MYEVKKNQPVDTRKKSKYPWGQLTDVGDLFEVPVEESKEKLRRVLSVAASSQGHKRGFKYSVRISEDGKFFRVQRIA